MVRLSGQDPERRLEARDLQSSAHSACRFGRLGDGRQQGAFTTAPGLCEKLASRRALTPSSAAASRFRSINWSRARALARLRRQRSPRPASRHGTARSEAEPPRLRADEARRTPPPRPSPKAGGPMPEGRQPRPPMQGSSRSQTRTGPANQQAFASRALNRKATFGGTPCRACPYRTANADLSPALRHLPLRRSITTRA